MWIAGAATVIGAGISAYSANKAAKEQSKDAALGSELGFKRQAWLDQQQQKFKLQDRQYLEDSIGGFRGFAPKGSDTFNGQPVLPPPRTSTEGLADWDPNKEKTGIPGYYSLLPPPKEKSYG